MDFNQELYFLGPLCRHGHDWNDTGKSLRYKSSRNCVQCRLDAARKEYDQRSRDPEWMEHKREKNREYFDVKSQDPEWMENKRERNRKYKQNNPEKCAIYCRARRARKKQNHCASMTPQVMAQRWEIFNDECAYCGTTDSLGVDHVIPIIKGGPDVPSNCVPCCHSCNCKKQHKDVETWYRSQPFFSEKRWRLIAKACKLKGNQLQLC